MESTPTETTAIEIVRADDAPLSPEETERLGKLEQVVEAGFRSFLAAGEALAEINAERLYRQGHPSFDAYLRERWGIGRARAYQLIGFAQTVREMSTTVDTEGMIEAQVRELLPLPKEERPVVWRQAVERYGARPTAKQVRAVVRQRDQKALPTPAAGPSSAASPAARPLAEGPSRFDFGYVTRLGNRLSQRRFVPGGAPEALRQIERLRAWCDQLEAAVRKVVSDSAGGSEASSTPAPDAT